MINGKTAIDMIKQKFHRAEVNASIPLQNGGEFTARWVHGGVEVDGLGNPPFLPWNLFELAVIHLARNGGRMRRGDAMNYKLGEVGLPSDSVEGHIAHMVYNRKAGDDVFQGIASVSAILVWAGICESSPGELILK